MMSVRASEVTMNHVRILVWQLVAILIELNESGYESAHAPAHPDRRFNAILLAFLADYPRAIIR